MFTFLVFCLSLFTIHFSLFTSAWAQDDESAPPPLKMITKDERTRLEAEGDPKVRTKLAVELIRSHIDAAEKANAAGSFDTMFRELGDFRGLVDYSLAFLQRAGADDKKTLDNYKRLELTLRAATPRIEAIRRELPMRYENYVRELLNYIRDARKKATEVMFSDTVLPDEIKSEEKQK